jgi:hypothetical protein
MQNTSKPGEVLERNGTAGVTRLSTQECHSSGFYLRTRARENLKKKPRISPLKILLLLSVWKSRKKTPGEKGKSTMHAKPKLKHEEKLWKIRAERREAIRDQADALQFEHDFGMSANRDARVALQARQRRQRRL